MAGSVRFSAGRADGCKRPNRGRCISGDWVVSSPVCTITLRGGRRRPVSSACAGIGRPSSATRWSTAVCPRPTVGICCRRRYGRNSTRSRAGCELSWRNLGSKPDAFGLIHADLHLENALFDGDAVRVIDFDDCGFGYWLYDLAVPLWDNRYRADYPAFRAALLEGTANAASCPISLTWTTSSPLGTWPSAFGSSEWPRSARPSRPTWTARWTTSGDPSTRCSRRQLWPAWSPSTSLPRSTNAATTRPCAPL